MKFAVAVGLVVIIFTAAIFLISWGAFRFFEPPEIEQPIPKPEELPVSVVPERPASPELDITAECVWLTYQVFGEPHAMDPPDSQLKFLKDCLLGDESWESCRKYSEKLSGNDAEERSQFFFKCLNEVVRSNEKTCCYDAWECRMDLHYEEEKREEVIERCIRFCDRNAPLRSDHCYRTCAY